MSCYLAGTMEKYHQQVRRRRIFFLCLLAITVLLGMYAVSKGAYHLPLLHVLRGILGNAEGNSHLVIWNIRMPRIAAAVVSGWGLALSGLLMQSLLRNPLASSTTLGISQGAAFGAAVSIIVFHSEAVFSTALFAGFGAIGTVWVILLLAKLRKLSSEAIILAGVALSSLFHSGTVLIQYFATETQIASALFWTFGDVARSGWREIGIMSGFVGAASLWVCFHYLNLNALLSGEESAKGLGVSVESLRVRGMIIAALTAAVVTAFHGVIAFLGLLAPHIAKRIAGADHRFQIPFSCIVGAGLLLLADTTGRILIGSGNLPVGVLTSFMGAPLFLYLLLKGFRQ